MNNFDQEITARTAMGEARGEGDLAMQAVMWSGINRYTAKRWFSGLTIAGTFLKKEQYSCWLQGDANYAYLIDITSAIGLFAHALDMAGSVIAGVTADPTQGATHYYDNSIPPPSWTQGAVQTVQIGRLIFYKDVA